MEAEKIINRINSVKQKSEALLFESIQVNLANKRLVKISSLIAKGYNTKQLFYLYFALLCNSIIEIIVRRAINDGQLLSLKKAAYEKIPTLLLILKNHRYIKSKTYDNCININKYRGTIHLNSDKDHNIIIKANNSIFSMCSLVEEIYQKYGKIKEINQTIINIIGGCELEKYSDLILLKKFGIDYKFLNDNYSQFINDNKLILITNNNVERDEYLYCIRSLLKDIIIQEEGRIYSNIFMNGVITASKSFNISEATLINLINNIKFDYNRIKNINIVLSKNYPNAFFKLIVKVIERQPKLIKDDQDIALDFAFFLMSRSYNKNLFQVTLILLKLYELSENHQIFDMISDIYWPSSPQTSASTKYRIDTIKKLFENLGTDKTTLYLLLIELLPYKKSTCSGYLDINGNFYDTKVTIEELNLQYQEFQELALEYSVQIHFQFLLAKNLSSLEYNYIYKFADVYSKDSNFDDIARKVYLAIYVYTYNSKTPSALRDIFIHVLEVKNKILNITNYELFDYIFNEDFVDKQVGIQFLKELNQDHIFSDLCQYISESNSCFNLCSILSDYKQNLKDNDIEDIIKCILSDNDKDVCFITSFISYSPKCIHKILAILNNFDEDTKIKLLCVLPINDSTVSILRKCSEKATVYYFDHKKDFCINRFALSNDNNIYFLLNCLLKYNRPYSYLDIIVDLNLRLDNESIFNALSQIILDSEDNFNEYRKRHIISYFINYLKTLNRTTEIDKLIIDLEKKFSGLINSFFSKNQI